MQFCKMLYAALGICPESHPYAFDEGRHCCLLPVKWNDTGKASDCDGKPIRQFSSKECCMPDDFVECDNKEMGCKSFNIGNIT